MSAQTVNVILGDRTYPIHIGPALLQRAGDLIVETCGRHNFIVVTDQHLEKTDHFQQLMRSLENVSYQSGHQLIRISVPPGEASKSYASLEKTCEEILASGIDRQTVLIAFGGGVVGDLAGFCAAILLRGLDFIQIPTSLLAQVDSSVGGKTGINSNRAGKNLIGSFHQPKMVLIDTDVLKTLPKRELLAGYAEVLKYGCILDREFFNYLEENYEKILSLDEHHIIKSIKRSVEIKAMIVAEDEQERSGRRALLNFGHTFGHAYEAMGGYSNTILHGEAIAAGMVQASRLSRNLNLCPSADHERLERHVKEAGLPSGPASLRNEAFPVEEVLNIMKRDKKASDSKITLILWEGIGKAFVEKNVDIVSLSHVLARPD